MINFIDCGRTNFIEQTKNKRLFCFGAGKYLQHFIESNYGVDVEAIIDNFRYKDETPILIGNKSVSVISAEKFEEIYTKDCAVIITCLSIEDVLAQLDAIPKLDGMSCYVESFIEHVVEESEIPILEMPQNPVIPKKIHYCWFGGNALPEEYQRYIESWKKYCPDYEIIRWDESNYDVHKNIYMSQAYEQKKWAYVSDYARVDILYQEGGIYFDTDVEVVAPFDKFLVWDLFCGFESKEYVAWGLGFGSVKGHPILKKVLDVYERMFFVLEDGSLNMVNCPIIQSKVLEQCGFEMNGQFQMKDGVVLYPKDFFSPLGQYKCYGNVTLNTHSIHHYAASWHSVSQKKATTEYENRILKIKQHNIFEQKTEDFSEYNKHAKIKKYQIWESIQESGTAGSKAPTDIKNISGKKGYQVINIHNYKGNENTPERNWSYQRMVKEWNSCYDTIADNSILLLQHPFWQEQKERNEILLKLKKEKNVKIISLVHDVENLRKTFQSEYMQQEFEFMLEIADVLIVHNESMKDYFISLGIKDTKIVTLSIFDYFMDEEVQTKKSFESSISIAGNLDAIKSPYIGKLQELENIKIHLYGPNYKETRNNKDNSNILYHGSFPANEVPMQLNCGFGLVWDGDSLEGCAGNTGEYLKYNNPHKLSLYLAAGLPVIVWSQAATADFVLQNGLGFVVNSLYEIEDILLNMTIEEYREYVSKVNDISKRIRCGQFTTNALKQSEVILDNLHV